MIDMYSLMEIIGDTFFGGDTTLAGIVTYSIIIMVILALTKRAFVTLLISLPVTFVFSQMGVITQDLMILLIIVAVLGMAMTSRNMWGRD